MATNFAHATSQIEPLMVRVWPDNIWTLVEDFYASDWSHMSDDYQDIDFNDPIAFAKLPNALRAELLEAIFGF